MINDYVNIIGQPEGIKLEYKSVLAPSKIIAKIICAFANTEGGYLIFGMTDREIIGLSGDFHANTITQRAIESLTPIPYVNYEYILHQGKRLYVISVEKSEKTISLEGHIYIRDGYLTVLQKPSENQLLNAKSQIILSLNQRLNEYNITCTESKSKVIEHYQSILKIMGDMENTLYIDKENIPASTQEGKILLRILFSSFVDNFETYLSDLLYEIYLAKPNTLKSKQTVTLEEVLNCNDMHEFVHYWAKEKLGKLQKGSVKGFIEDNHQIKNLNAIDKNTQIEIEKILQIRHLYTHKNGIVDEKFLQYFTGQFSINEEHQISVQEVCEKLLYLANIIDDIDNKAITKYSLATL